MTSSNLHDVGAPRVSIVMAVRNGEKYLEQTLNSLRAQTFKDFELIVIDDGSQDKTSEILDACCGIALVRLQNVHSQGLAASLNRGIDVARGDFLARQDADDLSYPTRLAAQLAFFDLHPNHVLVGTAYDVLDASGAPYETQRHPLEDCSIRWQMLFHNAFCHSSVMLRRCAINTASLRYDPRLSFAQDYDLWSRLLPYGSVANLPEALVGLRQHPGSMSSANKGMQQAAADDISLRNMLALAGVRANPLQIRYLRAWYYGLPALIDADGRDALKLIPSLLQSAGASEQKALWAERLLRHHNINPLFFVFLLFPLAPFATLKGLLLRILGRTTAQPNRTRPLDR